MSFRFVTDRILDLLSRRAIAPVFERPGFLMFGCASPSQSTSTRGHSFRVRVNLPTAVPNLPDWGGGFDSWTCSNSQSAPTTVLAQGTSLAR